MDWFLCDRELHERAKLENGDDRILCDCSSSSEKAIRNLKLQRCILGPCETSTFIWDALRDLVPIVQF